jgi:hypothetical protein
MNFSGHVAMVATVVQDKAKSNCSSTLLTQTGGSITVSDIFTQTEQQIKTFEVSTQTEGGQEQIFSTKSVSTQTEDWQELTIITNSDDKMQQIHESLGTIKFADDVLQISQGKLILSNYDMASSSQFEVGEVIIPGNTQLDSNGQFRNYDEEIDNEDIPGLIDERAEELLGSDIYKVRFIESNDNPRVPGGPIKVEQVEDSSELQVQKSVKFQIDEDKTIEAYATHWQEIEEQEQVQQGQEQNKQYPNWPDQVKSVGKIDHNYRHGSYYWESVD